MSAQADEHAIEVDVVRDVNGFLRALAVRALVYMGEQNCPFEEEFDGNDFCGATHLIARAGAEPLGTLRLRWFANFAKIERVAVVANARDGEAARALVTKAVTLAARKGYRRLIGYVDATLVTYWKRTQRVTVREQRPRLQFSGRDYVEVELAIAPPADAISADTPGLIMLRPEGAWDEPGVLDRSAERATLATAEAPWRSR